MTDPALAAVDKRGRPIRLLFGERVCARPGCVSGEFRIDGYCDPYCRDVHELGQERDALKQQITGANVELAELRRANEIRTKSQKSLQADLATAMGENGRLRKALERIIEDSNHCITDDCCCNCDAKIARAALAQQEGEK
jgi:hypothetical protein